jgi:diguanylate cyclase (GGDEF)-like protein
MGMTGPAFAVDAQLAFAGLTLAVGLEQLWASTWSRHRRQAWWTGVCAVALSVQIGANAAVLQLHASPEVGTVLFLRYAAASVLPCAAVLLVAAFAERSPSRAVLGLCIAGAAVRLVVWPTTDLVYAHRLANGWPAYGPLPPWLMLPLVAVSFGYVAVTVGRLGSNVEVVALFTGAASTVAVTVLDFVETQPEISEQLAGWATAPLFAALLIIVGRRQAVAARDSHLLHLREVALTRQALAAEQALLHRATHDGLTGLANRSELRRSLSELLTNAYATLSVVHLGVDAMRSVNDSFGHHVGDLILAEIAVRLRDSAPDAQVVARVDGDEFVLVVTGDCAEVAEQVLAAVQAPYELSGFAGSISFAVGVAARTVDGQHGDADGLLHDADIAMHRAKAGGGRGIAFFDDWMRAELLRIRGLERRLSRALERDEITLHYEPIVSLATRRPIAYEALARWRCDGEMIPPAAWIPVAETTGHLIEIGRHLAGLATSQLMAWQAAGGVLDVSLNVSARQLRTPDLADVLDAAIADGLDPEHLWLEVTEGVAVDDDALRALESLRAKGFRIALDDFGTGYSSLHAIGRLPIDIVKIDRSFVAGLAETSARALVAAVVSIAEAHGLEIVAEGIETEEQAARLSALGCRWGQGYLFGRAAPAGAFLAAEVG